MSPRKDVISSSVRWEYFRRHQSRRPQAQLRQHETVRAAGMAELAGNMSGQKSYNGRPFHVTKQARSSWSTKLRYHGGQLALLFPHRA